MVAMKYPFKYPMLYGELAMQAKTKKELADYLQISNSMRGITEKGKAQIGVRVAMRNSFDEINSILEVDNSYYQEQEFKNNINTLSTGEAINRWNEKLDDGSARLHLDKGKACAERKIV